MFQVLFQRLQPCQLLREIDGLYSRVIPVPVQLLLKRLVDLIQRTQQELQKTKIVDEFFNLVVFVLFDYSLFFIGDILCISYIVTPFFHDTTGFFFLKKKLDIYHYIKYLKYCSG